MRAILSLLLFSFVFAGMPAQAQPASITAPAPASSHVAAARDMLQAMTLDNGTLEIGAREAFRAIARHMRSEMMDTPFYAGLSPAHKQALDAVYEPLALQLGAETVRVAPPLLDEYAPRFAALMSEQALIASAAFLRSAEGRAWALYQGSLAVNAAAPGAPMPPPLSDAEAQAAEMFLRSPAGLEFNAQPVGRLSNELGRRATSAPSVAAMMRAAFCRAVEDQCPQGWRP